MLLLTTLLVSSQCPCVNEYLKFTEDFHKTPTRHGCNYFCYNLNMINAHNTNPSSRYKMEVKWFHDELKPKRPPCYTPNFRDKSGDTFITDDDISLPTVKHSNWFEQGRVTDIRNQGQCGDCWAESAVGVLESLYEQQYGKLVQLSVQQAAECTPQESGFGCEGGWPINVLRYVKNVSGGICTEKQYPTLIGDGVDRACNVTLSKLCNNPVTVDRILSVPTGNETVLQRVSGQDVVSVAIDASGAGFMAYSEGVYDGMINGLPDCSRTSLDHAVVVVGMGERLDGTPYYLVRNSWGDTQWGKMGGYILMLRGNNTCGIAQDAVVVRS